ncbi:MAG: glycosyltransferase [Candidatus Zixiibacteriota bacterium]|nr:MAG: glycosyltransferase [candidate division Zixibacteria bacterium]
MKILWVNSGLGKTFSNTRLFGIPPALRRYGDESLVLIAGRAASTLPDYFLSLPLPLGKLGAYRRLLTVILPFLCLKYRPEVLLSDWMSARQMAGAVLLRRLGLLRCRLVHDVRTVPVKEDQGKSWSVYAGSLEFARRHFDGITTITEPLREEICRQFDLPPDKIAVWTSGVDVNHFQPKEAPADLRRELGLEGKFVVFYHGSVNENRGVLELARAAEHLSDMDDLRLLILGGGNLWKDLEATVRDGRLDKVVLKPGVPYDQIPRWIALADLCVVPLPDHPWWRVSSPLKLMEYLAMGKPVLLTEMSAHRAVIPDDDQAFYVSEATPEALAQGVRRAREQRDRFAALGEWGRRKAVQELTWDRQAEILRDYLHDVVGNRVHLREGRK